MTFLDTGEPSYFNRYRYCSNDPINCTDPTGMYDWDSDKGFFANVGAAIMSVAPGGYDPSQSTGTKMEFSTDANGVMSLNEVPSTTMSEGTTQAIGQVGTALAASAATLVPGASTSQATAATRSATATVQGADEVIYVVPGAATKSGKDYVGRTSNFATRSKHSADGRNRSQATIVGRASSGNARAAEQNAMNRRGGVGQLDNKRNEISPCKWAGCGVSPPK